MARRAERVGGTRESMLNEEEATSSRSVGILPTFFEWLGDAASRRRFFTREPGILPA